MATIVTRAGKGSPLTHDEVDDNFSNLNTDKVETSAIGTAAAADTSDFATAAQGTLADSAVQPNDSPTFASVDVDNAITAGSVDVNGLVEISSASVLLDLMQTDTTDWNTRFQTNGSALDIRTLADNKASAKTRMRINHSTGDISFYEDTGTTPKFFWDASAERLGVGTSIPATALDVNGTVTATSYAGNGSALTGVLSKGADIVGAGVDLNTYTTDGYYHQNANSSAASGTNYPVSLAGMLTVMADGNMVYQKYQTYNGSGAYQRTKYNSTWYAWDKIFDSGNDGSGSGLDADTVDGVHESTFMRKSANSQLDMNNNDIVGVDALIHEGDSNTYIQFHASDQWRVVTGGAERLEVNNSQITSTEPIHAPSFHGAGIPTLVRSGVLTSSGGYRFSYSHGQGSVPDLVWVELTVKTAKYGYAVGTVIKFNNILERDETDYVATISATTTKLNLAMNNTNLLKFVAHNTSNSQTQFQFDGSDFDVRLVGVWF